MDWTDILPLVGSFTPATPIADITLATNTCCVVCHDVVFNPDLNELVAVYDCDSNSDGYGDEIFLARLSSTGSYLQPPRRLTANVTGIAYFQNILLINYYAICTKL